MSLVCKPASSSGADINLTSARKDLANKLQEITPVMDFYKELCLGWKRRLNLAETALSQLPATDSRNRQILEELMKIARKDAVAHGITYVSISKIKTEIEEKIQDLDLLALKNTNRSEFSAADIGLTDIQRLLHTSDALLELRGSQMKELKS